MAQATRCVASRWPSEAMVSPRKCSSTAAIHARLRAVGLASSDTVPLPFRQQDLADSLGLSLVHTNKTLKVLRDRRIMTWADGRLHIKSLPALAEIAMIDLEKPERRPLM